MPGIVCTGHVPGWIRRSAAGVSPARRRAAALIITAALSVASCTGDAEQPLATGDPRAQLPQIAGVPEPSGDVVSDGEAFAVDLPLPPVLPAEGRPEVSPSDAAALGSGFVEPEDTEPVDSKVALLGSYVQVRQRIDSLLAEEAEESQAIAERLAQSSEGRWQASAADVDEVVYAVCADDVDTALRAITSISPDALVSDLPVQYELLLKALTQCPGTDAQTLGEVAEGLRLQAVMRLAQTPVSASPVEQAQAEPSDSLVTACGIGAKLANAVAQDRFQARDVRGLAREFVEILGIPLFEHVCPRVVNAVRATFS